MKSSFEVRIAPVVSFGVCLASVFLFISCGKGESAGAGGSLQEFSIAGAILKGSGPNGANSSVTSFFLCGAKVLLASGEREIQFKSTDANCLEDNSGHGALSSLGFTRQQIDLVNESIRDRQHTWIDLKHLMLDPHCKLQGDQSTFSCISTPYLMEKVETGKL